MELVLDPTNDKNLNSEIETRNVRSKSGYGMRLPMIRISILRLKPPKRRLRVAVRRATNDKNLNSEIETILFTFVYARFGFYQ